MKVKVFAHQFQPPDGIYAKREYPATDRQRPFVTTCRHQYCSPLLGGVVVPEGFRLDFASVPTWLLWLYPPDGSHQRAALFHDWLYQRQNCSRFEADALFRAIMLHDGVPRWRRLSLYGAVRAFGGRAWRANRRPLGGLT